MFCRRVGGRKKGHRVSLVQITEERRVVEPWVAVFFRIRLLISPDLFHGRNKSSIILQPLAQCCGMIDVEVLWIGDIKMGEVDLKFTGG